MADGDTVTVLDESQTQHKIRLDGINAPEKAKAFDAAEATAEGARVVYCATKSQWSPGN